MHYSDEDAYEEAMLERFDYLHDEGLIGPGGHIYRPEDIYPCCQCRHYARLHSHSGPMTIGEAERALSELAQPPNRIELKPAAMGEWTASAHWGPGDKVCSRQRDGIDVAIVALVEALQLEEGAQ